MAIKIFTKKNIEKRLSESLIPYISILILVFLYVPVNLINITRDRVIEVLILLEFVIFSAEYLLDSRKKIPNIFNSAKIYLLFSLISLLLISFKPDLLSDELKHMTHYFIYSCLSISHYFIISNQNINSLKPLKIALIFSSIVAIYFCLLSTTTGYNEIIEIVKTGDAEGLQKLSQGYLSLEEEAKQIGENKTLINYLGSTNGRAYNLILINLVTIEIVWCKKKIVNSIRLIISLFLVAYAAYSISRGALILSILYFLYSLILFIKNISINFKSKKTSNIIIPFNFLIFLIFLIFVLPFGVLTLYQKLIPAEAKELSSFFLLTKYINTGPITDRFFIAIDVLKVIFRDPLTLLFGNGYLYLDYLVPREFNYRTVQGIGQNTWLEIIASSGIFAGIAYPYFLFQVYQESTMKIGKFVSKYKTAMFLTTFIIFILGFTIHHIDKLPRIIVLYFTVAAWISAYNKYLIKTSNYSFSNE